MHILSYSDPKLQPVSECRSLKKKKAGSKQLFWVKNSRTRVLGVRFGTPFLS